MGMPTKIKSKEEKKLSTDNASKGKRKKWSKGRTKDKVPKLCLFERDLYKKFIADVPKYNMISVAVLADRFKINGSLARAAINEMFRKNLIVKIFSHGKLCLFKGSDK